MKAVRKSSTESERVWRTAMSVGPYPGTAPRAAGGAAAHLPRGIVALRALRPTTVRYAGAALFGGYTVEGVLA